MKKKLIKKLMTAIAAAGGMLAGAVNGYAQTTTTPTPNPNGSVSSDGKVAPTNPPSSRDAGSGTSPGSVAPAPGTGVPVPLPQPITPPSDARPAPMPSPDAGGGTTTPPTTRPEPLRGNVTLSSQPVRTLEGTVTPVSIPATPQATNSGVAVFAGDIGRAPTPVEGTPAGGGTRTAVQTLVQQFDVQRTQELAARAMALEQLRTASPEQRSLIIAEMQATAQRQAAEQREAARELRNELRTMREERKGR